ncbi:MAG: hypothetical protein ABI639_16670 [Thermoanaerobaculia bacterium]
MQSRPNVEDASAKPVPGAAQTSGAAVSLAPEWKKPLLSIYGDVRQLTMGASPTTGESGNPAFRT